MADETADKVARFLGSFDTAEDFRAYCAGNGIRATRSCPVSCLVAIAIDRALHVEVTVGPCDLGFWPTDGPASLALPRAIQDAVYYFDAGRWPELITR